MRHHDASWAAFLARIGWSASYTRGCFATFGDAPLLVVPTRSLTNNQFLAATADAEQAAIRLAWPGDVLIVGGHPLPAVKSWLGSDPPAGLLGQRDGEEYDWDAGLWLRCDACGRLGVYHEMRS